MTTWQRRIGHLGWILLAFGCSDPGAREAGGLEESPDVTGRQGPGRTDGRKDGGSDERLEPWNGEPAVLDVPLSGCVPLAFETCDVVYGPGAISSLHRLQGLGDRWLAEGVWDSGFVLFDHDGKSASESIVRTGSLDRVTASTSHVHVATIDGTSLVLQRYDASGSRIGGPLVVADEAPDEIAIGRIGEGSLVVWATPNHVVGRVVGDDAVTRDPFLLEDGVWKDGFRAVVAGAGEGEAAIAWSDRRVADSHHRVFFARAGETGLRTLPKTVIESLAAHHVIDLERTENGYVLLVQEQDGALVVPLNAWGEQVGPSHRYLGISRLYGIAVHESGEMLLAAFREDGLDAILRLDASGAPRGDWMCMDIQPSDTEHAMGLAPTDEGYAILFRSRLEQELLYRLRASAP